MPPAPLPSTPVPATQTPATPGATPTLDERLCFALYGASLAVNRLYKPLLDDLRLTYPQFLALSALWEKDAQPLSALAARLSLEPSTLTPLCKRLEAAGLLERARNERDERQVILRLTARGRALRARCAPLDAALLDASGLGVAELQRLAASVKALRDTLSARPHPVHADENAPPAGTASSASG